MNGANFTDGLDGLASSVTVLIATFFTVAAIGMGHNDLAAGIWPVSCATVGSLLGFLVFNVYPARVFMGDTGSLALGGFVAATALMLRLSLFIPIVALIYMIEVLPVFKSRLTEPIPLFPAPATKNFLLVSIISFSLLNRYQSDQATNCRGDRKDCYNLCFWPS